MPLYEIHLTTKIPPTFRSQQVAGMFDLPAEELESRLAHTLTAELPGLDEDWTIGAIVGPSGSGKTTLARAAYGDAVHEPPEWPEDLPVIECLESRFRRPDGTSFGEPTSTRDPRFRRAGGTYKDLLRVLTAVGLSSPPSWLRPYRSLSTGERFRADLARAILSRSPLLVIDEFTSTLDRITACTASASLGKFLRGLSDSNLKSEIRNLKFVVLSCHTDILPWLAPDWVLDLSQSRPPTPSGPRAASDPSLPASVAGPDDVSRAAVPHGVRGLHFRPYWPRGSLQRPTLRLAVRRVPQAEWPRFARHHYLSGGLATAATCYAAFWEGSGSRGQRSEGNLNPETRTLKPQPIAFCAALATLGWKRSKRISRLVVLPEFQGLGIGPRLAETVAEHEAAKGNRVTITASHPALVAWCARSPRWRYTGLKKTGSTRQRVGQRTIRCSTGRAVASFEFVPPTA